MQVGDWLTISPDENLDDAEGLPYQVAAINGNDITLTDNLDDEATFDPNSSDPADIAVHLHDGASTLAEDLEPEYITVSKDSKTAFVTCQENNAIAIIDIASASVTKIFALGSKNHMKKGNELDVSNKDDVVNIQNWPIRGLYLPDAIASYDVRGRTFLVTANEGDARAYNGFNEEVRFKDVAVEFNTKGFDFSDGDNLGRIKTTLTNDSDGNGIMDTNFTYGSRSFSIWASNGKQVFDSGSDFAHITANRYGIAFNNNNDETSDEDRSDDKGCEPEAIAVGQIDGAWYAFIGLERMGGIMVYNISLPNKARFVEYINNRDINVDADKFGDPDGDYGPEGFAFVSASDSPNGKALLIVASEVSGTTTIYEIESAPSVFQAPHGIN